METKIEEKLQYLLNNRRRRFLRSSPKYLYTRGPQCQCRRYFCLKTFDSIYCLGEWLHSQ